MSAKPSPVSAKAATPASATRPRRLLDASLDHIPEWLRVAGVGGWLIIGVSGAVAIAAWLLAASASISVPLLLAGVLGIVFAPLVDAMERRGLARAWGTAIVMVLLVGVAVLTGFLVVRGVIVQWPAISEKLQVGIEQLKVQLGAYGWDVGSLQRQATTAVQDAGKSGGTGGLSGAASGVLGAVGAGLSSTLGFLFGLFIAGTLLFYVLEDYPRISQWTASHMFGLPRRVGLGLIDDASFSLRGYVRGTTISGLIVAAVIALAALLLKVPLVVAIFVVTFLTCYIPFFGAIISSVFAFVIALGGRGFTTAIILLIVILLTQNVLQTVINAKFMGESLELHPLVVLVVTLLGGIFGGLLGATLAAPLTALAIKATRRITAAMREEAAAETG